MTEDTWQNIISAPINGERVIVALAKTKPNGEHYIAWATSAFFDVDREDWSDGVDTLVQPTHWMPLTPPKED